MTASLSTAVATAAGSEPSPRDLQAMLARMKKAQLAAGAPDLRGRLARLDRLEQALLARKDAFVAAVSRDFGHRCATETLTGEIFVVVSAIRHVRDHLADWMETEDRKVHWAFLPSRAQIVPQPLGVVGIISPWNYPIQLALSPLVSAVAAGNRAMIKPSELVPETVAVLGDVIAAAFGRGEDEVCVVTGGPEVGEAFSRLPFDHLLFTGSTRVGKLVMRAASEELVPVTLELGGKSPAIVAEDYPLATAAERIMAGKLFNAGQTCVAPDYVMVPEGKVEAFVAACRAATERMYPTLRENPDYTTIITEPHAARLRRCVEDAAAKGARLVEINPGREALEGTRKMAPVLVLDSTDEMLLLKEEIFGPVLPILAYASLDRAIAYINDRPRPLSLYCFSHDEATVERVLGGTISGAVTVNETLIHLLQEDLPLGGVGSSGMGQYHGREGFDTFSKRKPVYRQSRLGARGLLRPPYGKIASRIVRLLVGK